MVASKASDSASAASASASAEPSSTIRCERRAARSTSLTDSSSVAAWVTRAVSSWASSMTTASYSGIIGTPSMASMASSEWLVTMRWERCAFSRASSAKHSWPKGHLAAPRHSRWLTLTWRHSRSVCRGALSRSPVPPSSASFSAQPRSSRTVSAIDPTGTSTRAPWSSGTPSRMRCRQA